MARRPAPVRIRKAVPADGRAYLGLVRDLARFEKLRPPSPAARRRLLRDAFGRRARYELLVAEDRGAGRLVGYAIVVWTYSSFLARPTLYLEDIYIRPELRGQGVGQKFLSALSRKALVKGAGRLEGVVLAWNRSARSFYRRAGARELSDWVFFRFDEGAMRRTLRKKR